MAPEMASIARRVVLGIADRFELESGQIDSIHNIGFGLGRVAI